MRMINCILWTHSWSCQQNLKGEKSEYHGPISYDLSLFSLGQKRGLKKKSRTWRLKTGLSYGLSLGADPAHTTRYWCSPVKGKQFHRTPISKATSVTMMDQEKTQMKHEHFQTTKLASIPLSRLIYVITDSLAVLTLVYIFLLLSESF